VRARISPHGTSGNPSGRTRGRGPQALASARRRLATDRERIDLIKDSCDPEAANHCDSVYKVIQRQNNALLHPSPLGYSLATSSGRRQVNRLGADGRWRDDIAHGSLGFYLVIRVLAKGYGLDRTVAERIFAYSGCLSHTFSDEELRSVPRLRLAPVEAVVLSMDLPRS
jgi:hypothetical protein